MHEFLRGLYVRFRDEPVLLAAAIGSFLVVLVQFGIPVPEKLGDALSAAIIASSALVARRKVKPTRKAKREQSDPDA